MVYQPELHPRQIKALYYLKRRLGRPMTALLREAVEIYLEEFGGADQLIPKDWGDEPSAAHRPYRRSSGLRTPRPPRFKT